MQHKKTAWLVIAMSLWLSCAYSRAAELSLADSPRDADFILSDGKRHTEILLEGDPDPALVRAREDLTRDILQVTGTNLARGPTNALILIGTTQSKFFSKLVREGKLDVSGVRGEWESYVLQIVKNPMPGVDEALVIAGSDQRGTIYGIYHLSEMIGVSPWHWWADVPVKQKPFIGLKGSIFKQGPPAVKYRGIFLNDEDWGLRPWAAKTLEPENGNIGPKTYAKLFELLLRLRANLLWPAMHPGTKAFNQFETNKFLADEYGIVMGASHCEQMLRNNVAEWDTNVFGEYNYVTNPEGVLKYWEQRVKENGKFDNLYTLGMRGIHDGAMPGGGTSQEKADRLIKIIADQRELLARNVNTNVAQVPQIFCPYKEVLPLYRLRPDIAEDITLVWPDDNYGYIRQFSDTKEQARSGGAGVYYHISYWGRPRDYLWLCSTPPALIAEEMCKAYDYGADKVWILNVGDLKPGEINMEFFLKLAWNPHVWTGQNTYDLIGAQLVRDFGVAAFPLVSILGEYDRLNFLRKPEHLTVNPFSREEAATRLKEWQRLVKQLERTEEQLSPESRDAVFEMIGYSVRAAALANERGLSPENARQAQEQIHQLTARFNNDTARGKWRNMMSDNPRGLLEVKDFTNTTHLVATNPASPPGFLVEAEAATTIVPGKDAKWKKIVGLGYNGQAISIFPTTVATRSTPEQILAESPALHYLVAITNAGDWRVTVRALPTFSVETGKPQRYAIAFDNAVPQIVSLPLSQDEQNRTWQENVLRNAALTTSTHHLATTGNHTMKIWMVDPGIVIDAIIGHGEEVQALSYTWR